MARKKKTSLRGLKGGPDEVDVHVGARVRNRRVEINMTQQELGRLIGITFQQLQKNERGTNRLSASRLFETARALDVPVAYFFEGYGGSAPASAAPIDPRKMPQLEDIQAKAETQEMVRAYYAIGDRKLRQQIVGTMRALARTDPKSLIHDRPRRGRPPKKDGVPARKRAA